MYLCNLYLQMQNRFFCSRASKNFYFGGRADEVSLWSKALTVDDVMDMMENELNGDEEGLEVYYK
mgnify:CR=1 FL=1